jgi:predicted HTH domain antitoxin
MTITIPDPIAQEAGLDEKEALKEFALALYAQERISPSQVRRMCGINVFEFADWVKERGLPVHTFTVEDFEHDVETLKKLGLW